MIVVVGDIHFASDAVQRLDERRTHSYVRHGTTWLFATLDIAPGFVIGTCYNGTARPSFSTSQAD